MFKIKIKALGQENFESSITQEPKTSVEHDEQVKDAKGNELVSEQSFIKVQHCHQK